MSTDANGDSAHRHAAGILSAMAMARQPTSRLCSKIVPHDQVLGLADLASVSGSRTTRRSGGDRLLVVVAQV